MAKTDKKNEEKSEKSEALTTVAPAGSLAQLVDNEYGEDTRAGLKELSAQEKSIPFLNLLQNNSPEVEDPQRRIEGARAGMFLNSVTKELIDGEKGLIIQPVHIDRIFVEWRDRDKGGGIVARHLYTSAEVQDAIDRNGGSHIATKENPLKHGENFLVDTRYLYSFILNATATEIEGYCVFAASKSKIKPTQDFVSAVDQMRGGPPLFAIRARMTSFTDKQKSSGKIFQNVRFRPCFEGKTLAECRIPGLANPAHTAQDLELLKRGKEFRLAIVGGKMQADFTTEGVDAEESEEATEKRHF